MVEDQRYNEIIKNLIVNLEEDQIKKLIEYLHSVINLEEG